MRKNKDIIVDFYEKVISICRSTNHIKRLESSFKKTEAERFLNKKIDTSGLDVLDAIHCVYDKKRTLLFLQEIRRQVKSGSHVLEAGVGIGVLSFFSRILGARIIGIELNKKTYSLAKKIGSYLKPFFPELQKTKEITIQNGNALSFRSKEKYDVIISENLYTGMFYEKQIQIMNHLIKFLAPGGKTIPSGIRIGLTLVQATLPKETVGQKMFVLLDHPDMVIKKLSADVEYALINFSQKNKEVLSTEVTCVPKKSGQVNAILVWTEVLMEKTIIKRTDTIFLNNDILISLKKPITVVGGKKQKITIKYKYGTSPEKAIFQIK